LQTYALRVEARPESIYDAFVAPSERASTFDPRQSPLYERVAFVVGAPRSGTTWLQQLLYVHPDVATGGESHLFCEGLPAVFGNFDHPNGMSHLSTWVARAELLTAARAFCDAVFETQRAATRPSARLVLEKTPNHRLQAALQAQLYPDARYVHIIRDGRDATASQRELWGEANDEFADADRAAEAWAAAVYDVRTHFAGLAYLEVRYEDIVADTRATLGVIFDHLGLAHDAALRDAATAFGRAPVHTSPQSPTVGIRKHAGDAVSERAVALAAGDLLVEFGYATEDEVAAAAQTKVGRRRTWRRAKAGDDAGTRRAATALAQRLIAGDASQPALAGARLAQRRVVGDVALLTFVTPTSERVVLRVVVKNGAATSVEQL
jgi:LPS sulfotransferase NodH